MLQLESTATTTAMPPRDAPAGAEDSGRIAPPQPKTVRDTGLELSLIVELVAKAMYGAGKMHLPVLAGKLRLSINVLREVLGFMLAEQHIEVAHRGDSDLDVHYQLTANGKLRGAEYLARCRYAGPAPVTLQAYRDQVLRQSSRHAQASRLGAAELRAAFADDSFEPGLCELLGAALQSSRSLLLYGPSGSGKTTLARKLGLLQQGVVALPYAILFDQDIVQFYDPLVHLAPSQLVRQGEERRSADSRWVMCQRPLVQVGAELDSDMLDLRHDKDGGVYHAPSHFMANNGILVVDDLGRQRMPCAELLNRWSGPLERGTDQLSMEGGRKVSVPFDVTLVFATNFAPARLLDDASMRQVRYKIPIAALGEAGYRALFQRQCVQARIRYDEAVLEHLIRHLHAGSGRALLASYPAELLGRIADFASFAGSSPRLTVAALEQAWASMFAGSSAGAEAQPPISACVPAATH
jgi:hypothetical protein